ncbi:hypothetical protein LCGC14_0432740 [marine sediment metagenome]|uniref:Uncharacterized protein n=1 Tax=marine sediment metagenome TaxID=412755 RepID=A0A0F9STT2_9ZZZZ
MDWSELGKNIIKFGAPILGGVVGGPAGAALGGTLAAVFGANPDDPQDIYNKMKGDPEVAMKLLEIQSNERIEIAKTARLNFEMEVTDKKNARNREIKRIALTGKEDNTPKILAYLLTVGFLTVLLLVAFIPIQKDAVSILDIMIGFLGGGASAAWGYYLGSSFGSRQKDKLK